MTYKIIFTDRTASKARCRTMEILRLIREDTAPNIRLDAGARA